MKTFNLKLISTTILTILLVTGCMPDSLTKFKKEPPKKKAAEIANTPVVTEDGTTINPATLTDPTIFKYRLSTSETAITSRSIPVGELFSLVPVFDGSIAIAELKAALLDKCEITSTTALPPGLSLNPNTCAIGGTPLGIYSDTSVTNYGKPIPYTIRLSYLSKAGTIKTLSTTVSLGSYQKPIAYGYTQNDKLLIRLTELSGRVKNIVSNTVVDDPYLRAGLISTPDGTVGVVKFIDAETNRIGLSKVIPVEVEDITAISYFDTSKTLPTEQFPSLVTARFISNSVSAIGKVVKLYRPSSTTTRGIIYVETVSENIFFADGQYIDDVKTFVGNATRITTRDDVAGTTGVNDLFGIRRINGNLFLDNDYQYFDEKFSVALLTRIFEPGQLLTSGIRIKPNTSELLEAENNVTFTVSPALPDGLSLNSATGEITGAFASILDATTFTITATNGLGSASAAVGLGAIYAPKDLAYTTRQLISVNSATKFLEGEMLFQPIIPPMETNIKARILRKNSTLKQLSIENLNGRFTAGASLDSGNAFYSEKSFVPTTAVTPTATTLAATPIIANYNIALTLADATQFAIEEYVSNAAGALGRIVAKDTANNIVYIQYLTPGDPGVAYAFSQGDSVDDAETFAAGLTTIAQIDANNLKMTLSVASVGAPTFARGEDITTSGAGELGAYVYDIDTSGASPILFLSDITKKPTTTDYFKVGQTIYDDETVTANSKTVSAISTVNSFFVENGVSIEITPNLLRGNSSVFSISPALPTGLTLDTRTGIISGKPTIRVARKEYTISAVNLIGRTQFVFELEVRDYFKVVNNSGAASFILHKYGDNQQYRNCKINATDIIEGEGLRDIRCFLEAEENDLHDVKLKFETSAGAGVCEFINVAPFSFYKFAPLQTTTALEKSVVAGCAVAGAVAGAVTVPDDATTTYPTAVKTCVGDYTEISTTNPGPNCDAGAFNVVTYTGTDNNNDADCTDAGEIVESSPVEVKCGGKPGACVEGPVRDLLDEGAINLGKRSIIFPTSDGVVTSHTFSAPINKGDSTNRRVANSTTRNACLNTKEEASDWSNMNLLTSNTAHPFGQSNVYYNYTCLDAAKDIKARIRIIVRDWDRTFKINYDIDLDEPASPAVDYMDAGWSVDTVFSSYYNNYGDWDDSNDNSYCSNGVSTTSVTCAVPLLTVPATPAGTWYVYHPVCSNPIYTNKITCLANGATWERDTGAEYGACGVLPADVNDRHKYPGLGL